MPTVPCPHCQAPLRLPDEVIGRKVKCPKCQELFTSTAPAAAVVAEEPAVETDEESAVEIDESEQPRKRRKGKRKEAAGRGPWVAIAAVVVIALVIGIGYGGYWIMQKRAISEAIAGEEWSHEELLPYLTKQGIGYNSAASGKGRLESRPAVYLFRPNLDQLRTKAVTLDQSPLQGKLPPMSGTVFIQRMKSAQEARDRSQGLGNQAFAWGRFWFVGDPAFLDEIRSRLPR